MRLIAFSNARKNSGQSLIELIVAIGLGIIFITGAIGALTVTLRLSSETNKGQPALELSRETAQQLRTLVNNDWHVLDSLTKDGSTRYSISNTASFYAIETGSKPVSLNSIDYSVYFVLNDVYRDENDEISETGTIDPSTVKATAISSWQNFGEENDVRFVTYLTRIKNRVWIQTDWSSGPVGESTDVSPSTRFSEQTNTNYSAQGEITIASTTINLISTTGNGVDPLYKYAFNDLVGWIDFGNGTVTFNPNSTTTGYGISNVGAVALDCKTTPAGDICPSSLFGVVQDNNNTLSGFAWNEALGWISTNCASVTPPQCAANGGYDYKVTIDPATGFLYGWAWSDTGGWISFNCDRTTDGTPSPENMNLCAASRGGNGQSNYAVRTGVSTVSSAVITSTILDSGSDYGVTLNTIGWIGTPVSGTRVYFQLAMSNSPDGPWSFIGPDGTSNSYYTPLSSGTPKRLNRNLFTGGRYFRFKTFLESDSLLTLTPIVKDVIINYSL